MRGERRGRGERRVLGKFEEKRDTNVRSNGRKKVAATKATSSL